MSSISVHLECLAGTDILTAASEMVDLANRIGVTVELKFNDVTVIAGKGDSAAAIAESFREAQESTRSYKIAMDRSRR